MKDQKGITLVALIITVIVLLILAGTAITISVTGGDLFGRSSNAVTQFNNKVNDENTELVNLVYNSFNQYYNQYYTMGN